MISMIKRAVSLAERTREEIGRIDPNTVAALPVAAIEQHGPHLPINTDELITQHVSVESARKATQSGTHVCVAPIISYGVSGHHLPYPGVLTLSHETLVNVLVEISESLILSGFKRIFILNGHGGNQSSISMAAEQLAAKHHVIVAAASYWSIAMKPLREVFPVDEVAWIPGHAGAFETACIRALRPELVKEDGIPGPGMAQFPSAGMVGPVGVHRHRWIEQIGGYTDVPGKGDADLGHRALEIITNEVATWLSQFASS